MNVLDSLIASEGRWEGTSRLQDPQSGIADEAPSAATITPVLGGRFVRMDYTWAYRGKLQEGSLLIGHDSTGGTITAYWIDSWHMGEKVMACLGAVNPKGPLNVHGAYAAPPGPDWGWRIEVAAAGQALRLVMFNVTPEGQEELAVEAAYRRAQLA